MRLGRVPRDWMVSLVYQSQDLTKGQEMALYWTRTTMKLVFRSVAVPNVLADDPANKDRGRTGVVAPSYDTGLRLSGPINVPAASCSKHPTIRSSNLATGSIGHDTYPPV